MRELTETEIAHIKSKGPIAAQQRALQWSRWKLQDAVRPDKLRSCLREREIQQVLSLTEEAIAKEEFVRRRRQPQENSAVPRKRKRTRVLHTYRLTLLEKQELRELEAEMEGFSRPQTRAQCGVARPCPWASCKHHLYLDVNPKTGSIKINSHVPIEDMRETCALDVAEQDDEVTLDRVGEILGLTRERIRQVQDAALLKIKPLSNLKELL